MQANEVKQVAHQRPQQPPPGQRKGAATSWPQRLAVGTPFGGGGGLRAAGRGAFRGALVVFDQPSYITHAFCALAHQQ